MDESWKLTPYGIGLVAAVIYWMVVSVAHGTDAALGFSGSLSGIVVKLISSAMVFLFFGAMSAVIMNMAYKAGRRDQADANGTEEMEDEDDHRHKPSQ